MPDLNKARILHLQRLSTEDGPGIRTTIFFKGCPLHCVWCHNPESISPQSQIQWIENRCIRCGTCVNVCPNQVLTQLEDGTIVIDRILCQGCGTCAQACPTNAMELLGQEITLDELVKELLKDRAYYTGGSGGVTASGGEPTMQSLFVAHLFARLQAEGIHTALDTCGACSYSSIMDILPHTDLVLYDLKLIDQDDHYQLTGQDNQRILTNLNKLADWIKTNQNMPKLWIRTPLIPDMTTSPDNLSGIGAFIREHLDGFVERWELCAFNNLCRDKYRRLGIPWSLNNAPLMSQTELDRCVSYARSSGFDPSRIILTGATQSENAY